MKFFIFIAEKKKKKKKKKPLSIIHRQGFVTIFYQVHGTL